MQSFYRSLFLSVLCILLAAASVQAGALWLYEEATPDMGVWRAPAARPPPWTPQLPAATRPG